MIGTTGKRAHEVPERVLTTNRDRCSRGTGIRTSWPASEAHIMHFRELVEIENFRSLPRYLRNAAHANSATIRSGCSRQSTYIKLRALVGPMLADFCRSGSRRCWAVSPASMVRWRGEAGQLTGGFQVRVGSIQAVNLRPEVAFWWPTGHDPLDE